MDDQVSETNECGVWVIPAMRSVGAETLLQFDGVLPPEEVAELVYTAMVKRAEQHLRGYALQAAGARNANP